jgi:DNA polymerase (family X)
MSLVRIDGIGTKLEKDLNQKGIKTIKQLYNDDIYETLPLQTRTYLKVCPTQIKRSSAKLLKLLFSKIFSKFKFTGSYRRKKQLLNDIDIVVKSNVFKKAKKYFSLYDPKRDNCVLVGSGSQAMRIYTFAIGDEKVNCYIRKGNIKCRVDINIANNKSYPFMILYSTGSKMFNVRMRGIAKRMKMMLNQKGLYKGNVRISGLNTEADIFNALRMKYLTPKLRNIE